MTYGFRIKGKGKRLVPADSAEPHRCVILAIDTASTSGWAVFGRDVLVSSGEVAVDTKKGQLQMLWACDQALNVWGKPSEGRACVLVLEKPYGSFNMRVAGSLIHAAKLWEAAWVQSGGKKSRIVRVHPQTWRSRVLGVSRGPGVSVAEYALASEMVEPLSGASVVGTDEAAAICIGVWAMRAGEVAKVIPKRFWGPPSA